MMIKITYYNPTSNEQAEVWAEPELVPQVIAGLLLAGCRLMDVRVS